jgi:hypothetical protein
VLSVLEEGPLSFVVLPAVNCTDWAWLAVGTVWVEAEGAGLADAVGVVARVTEFVGAVCAVEVCGQTLAGVAGVEGVAGVTDED